MEKKKEPANIPKVKDIVVGEEIHRKVREYSKKTGRSMKHIAETAINEYIK